MKLLKAIGRVFSRHKDTQPVVIFDIGSASVGGAVVSLKESPHVEYSTREYIPLQEVPDESHFIPVMAETLLRVGRDIQKTGLNRDGTSVLPRDIIAVFGSPWHDTRTIAASFEHHESFKVTDRVMDNLLAQIRDKKNNSPKDSGKTSVVIEEKIIHSSLNGYVTNSPLGKTARRINVTFLESTVSKDMHERVSSVIHEVFSPDVPLILRSFTLTSFSLARDMFPEKKNFLLVDVTGEVSEISVIQDSILGDTLSFPYGRNTVVRNIAKSAGSLPEETLSRVKMYFSSGGNELEGQMTEEEKRWTEMFGKACAELSTSALPLPQTVFLVADTVFAKWFKGMIERVDFSQFTITHESFQVFSLIEAHIEETCTAKEGVVCDSFLITEALFYNKEHQLRGS
ncbi:hypothetical protein HYW58_03235 [Candidatus Kaiserbacteria bacterium]|nr:hypothetical protein [Candidatus Kaiserbacteria bacterium]